MPPKGKKSAFRRPPLSSPSPRTPSTPASASADFADEALCHRLLASAAARYPSLISTSAAVAGVVAEVAPSDGRNHATVWISEAAMVAAAALSEGSLVSVSLVSSNGVELNDSPLCSLAEECGRYFDDDLSVDEAGRHFVIATVSTSRKVQKNGVRLSWDLACMMGLPSVGQAVFICPLCTSQVQKRTDGIEILYVSKCKDLYLNLVPPKVGSFSSTAFKLVYSSAGNGKGTASPKTPSSPVQNKPHDLVSSEDSSLCLDAAAVRSVLADEKLNKLLQTVASRWLYGRHLLKGNYVTVPMCQKWCLFVVRGAEVDCSSQDLAPNKDDSLSHKIEVSRNLHEGLVAFLVDGTTKVHLSDSGFAEELVSDKVGLPAEGALCDNIMNEDDNCVPKLGGLSKESAVLKEIISFSLANQTGLPRYKGVLLYGPPGTGKTSLACSCACDAGASLFTINGPEIISQYYGESEQALYDVFSSARQAAPAVVFIDELDAIAPPREDGSEELSLRMVATLLKLMDEISTNDHMLVIAATNRPNSIDPALRRPGRLDREIEIGVPSPKQRLDILQTLLGAVRHSLNGEELQSLALATHGFVGADLAALCNEAALSALRRFINLKENSTQQPDGHVDYVQQHDIREVDGPMVDEITTLTSSISELTMSSECVPYAARGDNSEISYAESCGSHGCNEMKEEMQLIVTTEDFEKAKMKVRPSAMREVMLELPKVQWEDVGGQAKVKQQLIEAIEWPQKCPEAFERIGIRPPRGLLMIGPPGCSKTLMARAVASEAKLNFLAVKGPELFSKWVGESEKAVRSLFAKARANAPAIIFFDEIDGLAVTRGHENDGTSVADRVLSQLLVEMDGLNQRIGVTVIAATNRPDKIDRALLRPGRFDRLIDVQPPDEADRADIFRIHMRSMPCSADVNTKDLASLTEGYTGADIKLVCREAALAALEESFDISEVSMRHFQFAISRVKPSDIQFYQELAAQFRRFVDDASNRDK